MTKEEESRKKSIQELLQFSVQFRYETSIFLLGEEKSSNFSGEKKGRRKKSLQVQLRPRRGIDSPVAIRRGEWAQMKRCRHPRCSTRGTPAYRGTFWGRMKAVRVCSFFHLLTGAREGITGNRKHRALEARWL